MKQSLRCVIFLSLLSYCFLVPNYNEICKMHKDGYSCRKNHYCLSNKCIHKPLFPLSAEDITFSVILFLGSVIAILCGSAGGLFYVPLLINILGFSFKDAVPISKAFILTKNTLMLIYYCKKKHPLNKGSLISLNNFLLILPNIYIGISIGFILYIILPTIILSSVFCLVIGFLVINVFKKSYERYLQENNQFELEKEKFTNFQSGKQIRELDNKNNSFSNDDDSLLPMTKDTSLEKENSSYEKNKPTECSIIYKITLCLLSIFIFMTFLILNGKSYTKFLNIETCSNSYWLLYFTGIFIQAVISLCISTILYNESKYIIKNDVNMGVIKYSVSNCLIFMGLGLIVGLISITFGLAGGFMANPFFIMIGFDPLVSVATATGIMEISSSSSLFKFMVNGYLKYDYAIFFCILLICSTLIGMYLLNYVLDNFKRTSFISFGMGTILAVSCINMMFHIKSQIMNAESASSLFEFKNFCSSVNLN